MLLLLLVSVWVPKRCTGCTLGIESMLESTSALVTRLRMAREKVRQNVTGTPGEHENEEQQKSNTTPLFSRAPTARAGKGATRKRSEKRLKTNCYFLDFVQKSERSVFFFFVLAFLGVCRLGFRSAFPRRPSSQCWNQHLHLTQLGPTLIMARACMHGAQHTAVQAVLARVLRLLAFRRVRQTVKSSSPSLAAHIP